MPAHIVTHMLVNARSALFGGGVVFARALSISTCVRNLTEHGCVHATYLRIRVFPFLRCTGFLSTAFCCENENVTC